MAKTTRAPARRPSPGTPGRSSGRTPRTTRNLESSFVEVATLILSARERALVAVNAALVELYWRVGDYIHRKIAAAEWGEGVVEQLADYLAHRHPDLKGFTRANLFRMRQFFVVYQGAPPKVAALLRQLPWTHNLTILSRCKSSEERGFYLRRAVAERWASRELEHQISA